MTTTAKCTLPDAARYCKMAHYPMNAITTEIALPRDNSRERAVIAVLFAGFVLTGVVTVLIGPVLPVFIPRWSLDDSQAGFFFTTQFAGSTFGVLISSALIGWGYRPALVLGYLLMGAGVAGLNVGSHNLALMATAAFGCGYGFAVPATNLRVAEAAGARRAAMVSLLNFAWGIGAVACPALILAALRHNRLAATLFAVSAVSFTIMLAMFAVQIEIPVSTNGGAVDGSSREETNLGVAIALGLLFFLYVGSETSIGGWAAEHAKRLAVGTGGGYGTLTPMFFWAGLLTGRGLAPLALLRIKEIKLVLGGLTLAILGILIVIRAHSQPVAIVGVVLAGLGCSSIFPIYVAWLSKWYGTQARRLGGIMFTLAGVGGSSIPWAVGFVSKYAGGLRVGLLVPVTACLIMIFLVVGMRQRIHA